MPKIKSEMNLMIETARLYYEHHFSQQQIANKLGISRPGISRLLQKARETGIVKIEILDPESKGTALEAKLKKKYKLKDVIIVPNENEDSATIKQRLGKSAVKYLDHLIKDNMILGVSWGTTMLQVAQNIQARPTTGVTIVQLNGGVTRAEYDTHASEVAQKMGEKYRAVPFLLPLPAIVDNIKVKEAILSDKNIAHTLNLGKQAEVIVFTIGKFDDESVLVKANYFKQNEVDTLIQDGAIADVCSRIIDNNGNICSTKLNDRTIGIELNEIKNKSYSIAVAGGKDKIKAITAALKGKLFNVLITDELVANQLN
jgi:deoxyribonucleoside regulator